MPTFRRESKLERTSEGTYILMGAVMDFIIRYQGVGGGNVDKIQFDQYIS